MKLLKYLIRCTTDSKDEFDWLEEGNPAPTTCPVDTAHAVDLSSVAIVDKAGPTDRTLVDRVGGPTVVQDGAATSLLADTWTRIDLTTVEAMHLQEVVVQWRNAVIGDYGWLSLLHPGGDTNPAVAVATNDTTVTVGAGKGAYYNPIGGAQHIEFWSDDDLTLIEMVKIASVSGDVVTLQSAVKNAHSTSAKMRVCYGHHAQMRGQNMISGGTCLIGDGSTTVGSVNAMTELIPAGMVLGGRFRSAVGGTAREVSINYKFRRPI